MGIELTYNFIFAAALLAFLAVLASVLSRRFGAPLLLVFLVIGMLAGEDGPGRIQFNDFGLAFLFGNLALAIIIFDGGLGTRRDTFRVSLKPALMLATAGVVITALVTGLAAYWILGLSWQEGLLIGAIVGSTDAAAVFGLLRSAGLELKERTGSTLEIESGSNDPMAIFLTVTLVEVLRAQTDHPGLALAVELLQQLGLGLALGFIGGHALTWLLQRLNLAGSLYPLLTLAGGLGLFGATSLLDGSGFLAIYIAGVIIGNRSLPYANDIHKFHDGLAWLGQIGMFLMLGLLITPSHLPPIILPAIAIALVLIFIARPLAVLVSLAPFRFPWREQVFIGWCGLRGAVPIILALFPPLAGLENTLIYFELVFFVVLISLILQGWSIAPLAKWLQIELPPTLHDPEHLTLKISKDEDKELIVYLAVPGCRAVGSNSDYLPFTEGGQLAGIVRKGMLVDRAEDQTIDANDQVIVLVNSGTTAALNRLFAPPTAIARLAPAGFFGDFTLRADIKIKDLAEAYGFSVEAQWHDSSVGEFLHQRFHGRPVVGDRVALGGIILVVKEVDPKGIVAVGLKFAPRP